MVEIRKLITTRETIFSELGVGSATTGRACHEGLARREGRSGVVGPRGVVFVDYFAAAMRSRRVGAEAIRDAISAGLVHARYSAAYSGGKTSTICSFSTHTSIT
jgi:hypothetical protein